MTDQTVHEFKVTGMTCGHCVSAVTTEVEKVPGVSDVVVDLDAKTVTVTGEPVDDAAVAAAVDEAGYTVVS
jgi:copper chaperone CopZ